MFELCGETALVTGASRGIGRGIAAGLAREGADVAVNYPDASERDNAEGTADAVEAAGSEALLVRADVADAAEVEAMVEAVHEAWGPVDVLVNNAGISERTPLADLPVAEWDRVVDVNLRGTFLPSRFAVPAMVESGSGVVVNVASQLGIEGRAEMLHYSAAKGGVIAFTRALAREVAPAVRVNAVAPGPIRTGKRDHGDEEWFSRRTETVPLDRIGDVEDVVATALFLASEGADYYTGQVLNPDGGETMY